MASITVRPIGHEGRTLVVIDDFATDPDALRASAAASAFGPAINAYPGVRAPLPESYLPDQQAALGEGLVALLGQDAAHQVIDASFSIVCTPPADLAIGQRLPHADAFDANRIALVHYLSADPGGTAFFRHRSTGFETIVGRRAAIYHGQLDAELRHRGLPEPCYVGTGEPLFERIATVAARPNRALLYRGCLLHSGVIAPAARLSPDPLAGRLTVTAFLAVG